MFAFSRLLFSLRIRFWAGIWVHFLASALGFQRAGLAFPNAVPAVRLARVISVGVDVPPPAEKSGRENERFVFHGQ